MNVSLIGASGYLGSKIATHLANEDFQVYAWGKRQLANDNPWLSSLHRYNSGDLTNWATVSKVAQQQGDVIIYCAALDHHTSEQSLANAIKTNVAPLADLLDRLKDVNSNCRFIYLSTAHVYGKLSGEIDELSATNPQNNYALTHLMAEDCLSLSASKQKIMPISLRLANGYGSPGMTNNACWQLVVNDLCKTAYQSQKLILNSDGTPERNFIHIDDIARCLSKLIRLPLDDINHSIYNLGGEKTVTMLELAHLVGKVYENRYNSAVRITSKTTDISDDFQFGKIRHHLDYKSERLKKMGITAQHTLSDGINEIFTYLENK